MLNRISFYLEMLLLIPLYPFLFYKGKKLLKRIVKLPPRSEFLFLQGNDPHNNLLIIGESTAAGVGATKPETTFAAQIQKYSGHKFNVFNLGKNGLKSDSLISLYKKSEVEITVPISKTIILIGANDCFKFTAPWKFSFEIKKFIQFLIEVKGVKEIIIPMIPPVQDFPGIPQIMQFFFGWHRRMLSEELKNLEKEITQLTFENHESETSPDFFSEDGIHPSDLGYEMIAKKLANNIK
jgi:lysophospholipase L1-like esterase